MASRSRSPSLMPRAPEPKRRKLHTTTVPQLALTAVAAKTPSSAAFIQTPDSTRPRLTAFVEPQSPSVAIVNTPPSSPLSDFMPPKPNPRRRHVLNFKPPKLLPSNLMPTLEATMKLQDHMECMPAKSSILPAEDRAKRFRDPEGKLYVQITSLEQWIDEMLVPSFAVEHSLDLAKNRPRIRADFIRNHKRRFSETFCRVEYWRQAVPAGLHDPQLESEWKRLDCSPKTASSADSVRELTEARVHQALRDRVFDLADFVNGGIEPVVKKRWIPWQFMIKKGDAEVFAKMYNQERQEKAAEIDEMSINDFELEDASRSDGKSS